MVSRKGVREHRPGGLQSVGRDGSYNRAHQGNNRSSSRDGEGGTPDGDRDGDMSESSLSGDDRGNRERLAEYGRSKKGSLPGAALELSSQKASLVSIVFAMVAVVVHAFHICPQRGIIPCVAESAVVLPRETMKTDR